MVLCRKGSKIIEKHYVYKGPALRFTGDAKPYKTFVKTSFARVRNHSAQTLIKPIVYEGFPHQLVKEVPKSLKKHYVYKVPEFRFLPFLTSSKPFIFIGQNSFPAHAIPPKRTFTGDRSTPMETYSKSKDHHARFLERIQSTARNLEKP